MVLSVVLPGYTCMVIGSPCGVTTMPQVDLGTVAPVVPRVTEASGGPSHALVVARGEIVVEDGRRARGGPHHALVEALLEGIAMAPEAVHRPVEQILVAVGRRHSDQEGGGGAHHPVKETEFAGGVIEAIEDHQLDEAGHPGLPGTPLSASRTA